MSGKSIFVCYRSKDSEAQATRLAGLLRDKFGEEEVFFAPWIHPGDEWPREVQDNLNGCRVLVALIGEKWESLIRVSSDASGDVVREEIRTALKRRIRVIPILIEGAAVPEGLPDDIRKLVDRQALRVRAEIPPEDCRRLFDTVRRDLYYFRTSLTLLVLTLAIAIALAFTGLFEAWGFDTRAASLVMALGDDIADDVPNDDVVVVGLRKAIEGKSEYAAARRDHARVFRALAESGARVLVVDFFFESETEADEDLADALREVRATGTKVVLAFKSAELDGPEIAAPVQQFADRVAIAAVGSRAGLAHLVPAAVEQDATTKPWFSLAVEAVACFEDPPATVDWAAGRLELSGPSTSREIPFFLEEVARQQPEAVPAIRKDSRIGNLALRSTPTTWLLADRRHLTYAQVLDGLSTAERDVVDGKIVVLGGEIEGKDVRIVRTPDGPEEHFGCWIHADTIRSLLAGRTVVRAGTLLQGLATLAMVLAASLLAFARWGIALKVVGGLALIALYLFASLYVYAEHAVVLSVLYPLFASLFAYGGARWVLTRYTVRGVGSSR